jgi:hypothetical protein
MLAATGMILAGVGDSSAGALAAEYQLIRGSDRYQTAIQVSQNGFAPGVEAVVVATGENYPDALSAAPLASAYGGRCCLHIPRS